MTHPEHTEADQRAARARALASSADFPLAEQISWASMVRPGSESPGPKARADLTHALVDAIDRHACVEFVCGLVLDGADPAAASDEGIPLWRAAIIADARRDEGGCDPSGWALLARLALGPRFLGDPRLGALREACSQCVCELQSHLPAQDAHFSDDSGARRVGELYSMLDARHDGAFGLLAARTGAIAREPRRGSPG